MKTRPTKSLFSVIFVVLVLSPSMASAGLIITNFDLTPLTVAIPSANDTVFHFNSSVQVKNDSNPVKVIQLLDYTFTLKETDLFESTADSVITTQGVINNFLNPNGMFTIQIAVDVRAC